MEFAALIVGKDKSTLHRRLDEARIDKTNGVTIREVFLAFTTHKQREEARALRETIEVETAEIEHMKAKDELVLKKEHDFTIVDLARQTRTAIENAAYIPKDSRKRLAKEIGSIRVDPVKPAK